MSLELNCTANDASVCSYQDDHKNVYLRPNEMHTITSKADIEDMIRRKIGLSVQQCCSEHGFVLSGIGSTRSRTQSNRALHKPLQIISRSAGEIPAEHLNGSFLYSVCYRVFACNPPIGKVLPMTVLDKNKLGIRCYYYPYQYDTEKNEVSNGDAIKASANFVVAFLPKALHYSSNHETDGNDGDVLSPDELYKREELRIDELLNSNSSKQAILHVKILQKRFDINDKQISTVGVLCNDGYTGDAYKDAVRSATTTTATTTTATTTTATTTTENNKATQ